MIRLFINYYRSGNPDRQKEYEKCLTRNLHNDYIDEIIVVLEGEIDADILNSEKVRKEIAGKRPTYSDLFRIVNRCANQQDLSIIANADIYFDHTIDFINQMNLNHKVLCLSRWNMGIDGRCDFFGRKDSQDAWIFQSKIPEETAGDFYLGLPGCDNKIAYEFKRIGYSLHNPSKLIKCYHLHLSRIKTYSRSGTVDGPYALIKPDNGESLNFVP